MTSKMLKNNKWKENAHIEVIIKNTKQKIYLP